MFYLSCKANSRVKLAKTGHGPHSSKMFVLFYVLFVFVSFCVLFVCKCVLYYCHRVTTQLQLINISYIVCPRRNVPNFGRVFLMLKYTDITQNTYVQI